VHGAETDKAIAIALAESMIRDSRMPDPETARKNRDDRLKRKRERRSQQPAEIRGREQEKRIAEGWQAQTAEAETPLYEALADAFDFADPELWKSNSFAALRPRLTLHLRNAVAVLERDLAIQTRHGRFRPSAAIEAKLARAREILGQLEALR
jgi:hypothetical protein